MRLWWAIIEKRSMMISGPPYMLHLQIYGPSAVGARIEAIRLHPGVHVKAVIDLMAYWRRRDAEFAAAQNLTPAG